MNFDIFKSQSTTEEEEKEEVGGGGGGTRQTFLFFFFQREKEGGVATVCDMIFSFFSKMYMFVLFLRLGVGWAEERKRENQRIWMS